MKNLLIILALCVTGSFVHGQEGLAAARQAQERQARIQAEEQCKGNAECIAQTTNAILTREYSQY